MSFVMKFDYKNCESTPALQQKQILAHKACLIQLAINSIVVISIWLYAYALGLLQYALIAFVSYKCVHIAIAKIYISSSIYSFFSNIIVHFGPIIVALRTPWPFSYTSVLIILTLLIICLWTPSLEPRPKVQYLLQIILKITSMVLILAFYFWSINNNYIIVSNIITFSAFLGSISLMLVRYDLQDQFTHNRYKSTGR